MLLDRHSETLIREPIRRRSIDEPLVCKADVEEDVEARKKLIKLVDELEAGESKRSNNRPPSAIPGLYHPRAYGATYLALKAALRNCWKLLTLIRRF